MLLFGRTSPQLESAIFPHLVEREHIEAVDVGHIAISANVKLSDASHSLFLRHSPFYGGNDHKASPLLQHLRLGTHFERYSFLFRASWKLPKNVGWNLESLRHPGHRDEVLCGGDRSERSATHMLGVILIDCLRPLHNFGNLKRVLWAKRFSRKVFSMYSQITVSRR